MWENSEREVALIDALYRIKDSISANDFNKIEVAGNITQIVVKRKDERGKTLVIAVITGILTIMVACYFGAVMGRYYGFAIAMIFATGLGMAEIVLICILIFMVVRLFLRHSPYAFWVFLAKKLGVENDCELLEKLNIQLFEINKIEEELKLSLKDCEQKLAEERAKFQ